MTLATLLAGVGLGYAPDWYVAPDGLESNPGTIDEPWDIESALLNTTDVRPGDTIWIRGGTYKHPNRTPNYKGYGISLQGNPDAPITVSAYQNERATIDGGLQDAGTPQHVRIMNLEVIVSENLTESRVSGQRGSRPTDMNRPWGGINFDVGHDIKFINNIVHDNSQGISLWGAVSNDSELYGNVIYDNGWIGPPGNRNHGHGVYTQNYSGDWKYARDNISFDNYSLPFKNYGEAATARLDQYIIERNFFIAGVNTDSPRVVIGGYADIADHILLSDNVFHEADIEIFVVGANDLLMARNTIIRAESLTQRATNLTELENFIWDGDIATIDGEHVSTPAEPLVFLNPNIYDSNRANLAILAFSRQTPRQREARVDMSPLLVGNETSFKFQLKDPADFYGAPVHRGTYYREGNPISIPITKEFTVYVVLKDGQWGDLSLSITDNSLTNVRDDRYATNIDTALTIAAPGVLGNDTDLDDGDQLSAILVEPPYYDTDDTFELTSDGAFTYTPNKDFKGIDAFTYRVDDGTDLSTMATVAIQVGPRDTSVIDFTNREIISWGAQDQDPDDTAATIEDGGSTLHIVGNSWKLIEFPTYISEDTILEFDFRSEEQGRYHAIGAILSLDQVYPRGKAFKLYGTQPFGHHNFNNYSGTNWKTYQIRLADYYVYTGFVRYLFFINDHDNVNPPTAESYFSNIRIYEETEGNTAPIITDLTGERRDTLYIEAESGILTDPMKKHQDSGALGREYIATNTRDDGRVEYSINIDEPGDYIIWCRILAPSWTADSFFVSVDGGDEDIYDVAERIWSESWQWTQVNGRNNTKVPLTLNPRIFTLSEGSHTITFRGREANSILDMLAITKDPNFIPQDIPIDDITLRRGTTIRISGRNFGDTFTGALFYNTEADFLPDHSIDANDVQALLASQSFSAPDNYDSNFDINLDGSIDGLDIQELLSTWQLKGPRWSPEGERADATYVEFAGQEAMIESWSDTEIKCRVPYRAQTGDVVVVTSQGRSNPVNFVVTE